jgi:hypothetical protein
VIEEVVMISNDYKVQGLGVVAISSNDVVNYPQDAPELMREFAFENNFDFYLYDETQEVARAYNAACTPDFFYMTVKTVYRGQLMIVDPEMVFTLAVTIYEGRLTALFTTVR